MYRLEKFLYNVSCALHICLLRLFYEEKEHVSFFRPLRSLFIKSLREDPPQSIAIRSQGEVFFPKREPEVHGWRARQVPASDFLKKKRLTQAKDSVKILFFSQTEAFFQHILRYGQFFPPFPSAIRNNLFPTNSIHSLQKPMTPRSLSGFWLIRTLRHIQYIIELR